MDTGLIEASLIESGELSVRAVRQDRGTLTLIFSGRLSVETVPAAWRESLALLAREKPSRLILDIAGLDYCDGSGAALLIRLERTDAQAGGAQTGKTETTGAPTDIARLLQHYRAAIPKQKMPPRRRHHSFAEQVGSGTLSLVADISELIAFVGESTLAFGRAFRHPRKLRWHDVLELAEATGFDAVPIIALLGFLIGLILAFQSAVPLRTYGADLFVANLLGLSLLRELGPLLTAVILAGRSGSAFAAEIGTMKVQEELDALKTMGLDPMLFLVVPRTLAAVLMMPLLTIFLDLCGLAGGAVVMRAFGIPPVAYIRQLLSALQVSDLTGGLLKALVFGLLVAGIGCYRGLGTGKGASAVGASTTSAVVSGIVLIIIADGAFSIVYYMLGL